MTTPGLPDGPIARNVPAEGPPRPNRGRPSTNGEAARAVAANTQNESAKAIKRRETGFRRSALGSGNIHTAAIFRTEAAGVGRSPGIIWRVIAMFKMPAYDPFSIALMGFGILLALTLAMAH